MSIAENPRVVAAARKAVAWPNRQEWLAGPSGGLMRTLARIAMRRVDTRPAGSLPEVFEQWQRAAPALADYRLTEIKGGTMYAEIHSPCALRGTGDVPACHRMMEYDHEIMRRVGGELTILESQATPGRTFCLVAIRNAEVAPGADG